MLEIIQIYYIPSKEYLGFHSTIENWLGSSGLFTGSAKSMKHRLEMSGLKRKKDIIYLLQNGQNNFTKPTKK